MSQSVSYRECWEKTVGQRGAVWVSILNILDPLLGLYANATILSQSLKLLLEGVLDIYWSVQQCLLVVTLVAILPLCLMKHLNALAPFSAIGMVAVVSALIGMTIRLVDGSYQPGGQYYLDIPTSLQPQFGASNHPWSTAALPFVCMVYTSYDMHYNSPSFYAELKHASPQRYAQTVTLSFGITGILYFCIAAVGFLTFGAHSDSYILNNYSPRDPLATLSRVAIGLCSLASYPLNYIGVRDNSLELLGWADAVEDEPSRLSIFTVILLSILTLTEFYVTDLGLINSVGGGTTVTLICFVFPAFMFQHGLFEYGKRTKSEIRELWLVMTLMIVGVILGIIGVIDSIIIGS